MNILAILLVGLISGWLAGRLMEGRGFGPVGDTVVGVIGAFIGGIVYQSLGYETYSFWGSVGMSTIGAVIFLAIAGLFRGVSGPTRI